MDKEERAKIINVKNKDKSKNAIHLILSFKLFQADYPRRY